MQEPVADSQPESQSATHLVHVLMQFAWAVRHRKNVMFASLLVAGLLGGLYYATATRYYAAGASLLVMQSGNDIMDPTLAHQGGVQQGLMPTYESLITSAKVIEGALAKLQPEDRIDLAGVAADKWAKALGNNLSAKTVRNTNIIQIEYLSRDPAAAVAVVNAVVESYLEFMDKTHKGTAGEIIDFLTREKEDLAGKLAAKEDELQAARDFAGDLGSGPDDKLMHPLVQRVVSFNEALIETRKERAEMEASLAAVEEAVRNGEGLQQHIMTVANMVGKEILLNGLGINDHDAANQVSLEKELLDFRSELQAMEEHLGPRHPQVTTLEEKIRSTKEYLYGYQDRVRQRLAEIQETQLGPLLTEMMRQKLNETWQLELSRENDYKQALADASSLGTQLSQIDSLQHEVTRLRDSYDALLGRIANIDMKHEGPDIRADTVSDPSEATTPVSPNPRRVALVVLIVGAAVGLLIVYVLDALDDRFRSTDELQQQLGAPVLAMVRRMKSAATDGLEAVQVHSQPEAAESEAFRILRTALSLSGQPSERLVISSSEPGDGKTTVLANLAVACAQAGKKTLLIDADLRRPGLTALMRLRGAGGLSNVLRSTDDMGRAAAAQVTPSGVDGLDVIPSGPRCSNSAELLAGPRLAELIDWAHAVYDQVLIDSPPALAAGDTSIIGKLVDGVILVVQPGKNRRRMVLRVAQSFARLKVSLFGLVVNRVDAGHDAGYYGYGAGDYGDSYVYHYKYTVGDDDDRDASDRLDPDSSGRPALIVPRRINRLRPTEPPRS